MLQRLKEQAPTIVLVGLFIVGASAWTLQRSGSRQQAALAPLIEQNDALRIQVEEDRRQADATAQLLRDALQHSSGHLTATDEEIRQSNSHRIEVLADAIAERIVTALPGPKTPEQAEQMQNEQINRISSHLAAQLRPILAEDTASHEARHQEEVARYNQRIRELSDHLQATQTAAQDALKLSHEITGLYVSSFDNQGVLVRLLALPADVVRDTVHGNLITSRDHARVQQELDAKMAEIEKRLNDIQTQAMSGT